MKNTNKPVFTARKGLVSASQFNTEREGTNGSFTSVSIGLSIGYPIGDGKFENRSISIVKSNLDNVIEVLTEIKGQL